MRLLLEKDSPGMGEELRSRTGPSSFINLVPSSRAFPVPEEVYEEESKQKLRDWISPLKWTKVRKKRELTQNRIQVPYYILIEGDE
jgi:hypothetical protein